MKNEIVLERIQVRNLFDRFSYDIDLKNGNNVAILIAPNGCGKTTIFNLIDFVFAPSMKKFSKISTIPFDCCMCTLSNGTMVGIERRKAKKTKRSKDSEVKGGWASHVYAYHQERVESEKSDEAMELYYIIQNGEKKAEEKISEIMLEQEDRSVLVSRMNQYLRYVEKEEIDIEELPLPLRRELERETKIDANLKALREKYDCNLEINFISADRLHKQIIPTVNGGYFGRRRRGEEMEEISPLVSIQRHFQSLYNRTDSEYARSVSEARDNLPKMYIDAHDKDAGKFTDFKKEWTRYIADMEKFRELGLINANKGILETKELEKAFKEKGTFLKVYLDAFKPTLVPWEMQYERLKLFADILNRRNRVTKKVLTYGPMGLVITVDGTELPLDCLSSGEKNDLIMFYNLIFCSKKGGLVLVDEPEISLHIEWQEEYLDCLLSICELNELQAIVATHSPNIVNGHFELYAERGLQDERRGD